ncbi:MAG: hypothetical protein J6X28_03505 [Bacilli bacterium]|nr:hypothetical protein [Bacilli bacterium]
MKKVLHFIWSVLEFIIIIYVIVMTSVLLSKNKYGYTQFGTYTISSVNLVSERGMAGAQAGDLLIVKNTNKIKVGDLIYYYVVYNESYMIQSDKVVRMESDDYSALYTIDHDGELNIASNRVLGKDAKIYHHMGSVLDVLESKLGFLFLVLLPILVIFIYQIYELVMIFRYESVSENDSDDEEDEKDKK